MNINATLCNRCRNTLSLSSQGNFYLIDTEGKQNCYLKANLAKESFLPETEQFLIKAYILTACSWVLHMK